MNRTYYVTVNGKDHVVRIDDAGRTAVDDGTAFNVARLSSTEFVVSTGDQVIRVVAAGNGEEFQVTAGGRQASAVVESERKRLLRTYARGTGVSGHRREIQAPMPALVVKIEVEVGQEVHAGQGLLILEAMKMENEIRAHQPCKVKSIHAVQGRAVEKGELLLVLE
ncbi:MAG: biotin/lipoyl-containing protein [Bacteroidota bacterium]